MTKTTTDVAKYPEHEKQSAVLDDAQVIGDFLTWLESSDGPGAFVAVWSRTIEAPCTHRNIEPYRITKCEDGQWVDHWGHRGSRVLGPCPACNGTGYVTRDRIEPVGVPSAFSIQSLLARYFGIDLDKIEAEKRAMLAELQMMSVGDDRDSAHR